MCRDWFSGDKHFAHKNIIRFCSRPYDNVHHMEEDIILKHNSVVSDSDHYWDLGDFAYKCTPEYAIEKLKRLNGKIHIILGNHDKPLRKAYNKGLCAKMIASGKLEVVGNSVDPSISVIKTIKIDGIQLIMSHYAQRSWRSSHHGVYHIFAHSHGNLAPYGQSFDVGVDTNNFCPYSFEDITKKMSTLSCERLSEKDKENH
jgi:calcineurin-like phosphoesterase family protein